MIYSFSSALSLRAIKPARGRASRDGREWKESLDDEIFLLLHIFSVFCLIASHCLGD